MTIWGHLAALTVALTAVDMASAQEQAIAEEAAPAPAAPVYLAESASPFALPAVANDEAASVAMPKLAFTPIDADAKDFDKYYFFYRADTDFATAYADIAECDSYARGLQSGIGYAQTPYPYAGTMAGALGTVAGNMMAAAIFGSAEKRRARRVNMRRCMNFKGYGRYGLAKELWEAFNFEEGLDSVSAGERQRYLKQQALVAATAKPAARDLGL